MRLYCEADCEGAGVSRVELVQRALEAAYKRSVSQTAAVKLTYLQETLGRRLTAAALGVKDTRTVQSWERGGPIRGGDDQEHRIQALFRATYAVTEVFGPAVAAAFLRGSNPALDGKAPLLVLADEQPGQAEERVMRAVDALLEA